MKSQYSIIAQRERVRAAFQMPRTMLEAARIAGVERANVCWYVHDCREAGTIYEIRKGICPVSGARARFYTTNANGWQHFVKLARPYWERLPEEQTIQVWETIRAYYLAHYNKEQVQPAAAIAETWSEYVRPLIDREVQL